MKHFTKCLKFLLLTLFVVGGVNSVWADSTQSLSWSRSASTDTYTDGFTFKATASAKNGYYQDASSGVGYMMVYHATTKLFSSTPASITFTAKVGGGNGNKDLSNNVYVCLVDASGDDISNTEAVVTNHITTATGDTYNISLDAGKGKDAYGVKIYHSKETGYNVRYFSFSLSYEEAAAPSYTINPATNNKDYGIVSLSGSVITATPKSGYRISTTTPYEVTSGTATVAQNGNDFTVTPSTDCTVQINFEEIPKYTVTLGDDSSTLTEESAGAGVTLPSRSTIGDYTFAGWSVTNVETETTSAPTIIPAGSYAPTANVTLYPVYIRTEVSDMPSEGEASTTIAAYASANSWSNSTQYQTINIDENITATASNGTNTGKYYSSDNSWRIYSSESATITFSAASGCSLNSVALTYSEGAFTYSGNTITSGKAVSVSGSSAVFKCTTKAFVNSIAVGYTISGSSTTYYLSAPVATAISTPTFTLAAGTYEGTQSVEIECATEDVTIYYTTNGDEPTTSSSVYSDAIEVSANTTIKAIAVKNEEQSNVGSATYCIKVAAPTFSIEAGTYNATQTVSLASATAGATIYYTTDGSTPTSSSTAYSSALSIATTTSIKAIAIKDGMENSAISEAVYRILLDNSPGTGYFEKVTNASALAAGDNILLVNEEDGVTLGTKSDGNNRSAVAVTISNDAIDNPSNVQRLILHGNASAWNFYADPNGYLYSVKGNNYLKTQANAVDASNATISITSGDATILFTPSNENRYLRYNKQSSLFSCYTSTSTVNGTVQIYKEVSKLPVTVSEAGYATYVNNTFDLDFSESSIKAYKVKVASKAVATLTQVDNVPAGTPVLLYKDGGATEAIPTMTDAAVVTDNDLVAGTGAVVATIDGEYTNMILNNVDDKIGFYYANGQTVAANRAYLHIATTLAPDAEGAGARMRFVFDDDASGIKEIATDKQNDAVIYNLNGQRVGAGYKGIVIKNGKKYLNK